MIQICSASGHFAPPFAAPRHASRSAPLGKFRSTDLSEQVILLTFAMTRPEEQLLPAAHSDEHPFNHHQTPWT
ncbi:MAG: hypothetical protein IIW61_02110 [Bacteroidaceae bacterium]|nr:hypothetical protein [Bacteroidaceae bacterium]